MQEITETGGAKIGNANATWPFAKLKVNSNMLNLNASIIGNLVFKPSDIVSIVPYSYFLSRGIKINHNVQNYKSEVIFWTTGNTAALISRIEQTGFLNNTKPLPYGMDEEITKRQLSGGFPLKTSAAIAIVIIWNILFLNDFLKIFNGSSKISPLGIGAQAALAFIFLTGLAMLINEPIRNLILKPGRTIEDVKAFIYILMFISGMMFLGTSIIPH